MQPFLDEDKEEVRRFVAQAGQAGGEQRGAHFRVADSLSPRGQACEETFLLRWDAPEQEGSQQAGLEPAFIPERIGEFERLDGLFLRHGTQLRLDLSQDNGWRPIRGENGRWRHALTAQCAVDVVIEDLAVFAQKVRWLIEQVSQLSGLFFEACEVYGGHDDLRFLIGDFGLRVDCKRKQGFDFSERQQRFGIDELGYFGLEILHFLAEPLK